jgi:hypothetical protein
MAIPVLSNDRSRLQKKELLKLYHFYNFITDI